MLIACILQLGKLRAQIHLYKFPSCVQHISNSISSFCRLMIFGGILSPQHRAVILGSHTVTGLGVAIDTYSAVHCVTKEEQLLVR